LIRAYAELGTAGAVFPSEISPRGIFPHSRADSTSGTTSNRELATIGTALTPQRPKPAELSEMRVIEDRPVAGPETRLASIARHTETTRRAPRFVEHYRAQLLPIAELAPQLVGYGHRLETEALLYAERADVTEG
jgi:uncharacterized protein YicC (UPF0701 family)